MAWLTVATVVKDDDAGFARSRDSLVAQEVDGVEWVVIDGSSGGSGIQGALAGSGVPVEYRQEPPRGIYPAMNSALQAATGDFIYFLNAGDTLAAPSVLREVRRALGAHATWGFGPVEIVESSGASVVTPPWDYQSEKRVGFSRGLFPSHQGTFAKVDALRGVGGFDTSYRVAADYAAFLRLAQLADPVQLTFVIARFFEGGTSTSRWQESFREFHRARTQITRPRGIDAVREKWETARHFGLVYAHRELRPRLSWPRRRSD